MFRASFICISLLLGAPTAFAQTETSNRRPIVALTKTVITMPVGQQIANLGYGVGKLCISEDSLNWNGEQFGNEFNAQFESELAKAGLSATHTTANLFESEAQLEDIAVGAVIPSMKWDACRNPYNYASAPYSGTGQMSVEWQVYSRIERRVIAKVSTSAVYEQKSMTKKGTVSLLLGAFGENARKLLLDATFRSALEAAAKPAASEVGAADAIFIRSSPAPRSISDGVGSVVAILAGGGHGSAFLISDDGYLLTNQHVVGSLKQVRVRWSDGFETVGDVVRSDARRDVALIKTDSRRRMPLQLRTNRVDAGEGVYSIGAPLDPTLQNTVTKGIASSNRIVDGLAFVQSDVALQQGNSGGPLLDEGFRVVGMAARGIMINGATVGINMFIPIGDALEFLNIRVQTAAESASR